MEVEQNEQNLNDTKIWRAEPMMSLFKDIFISIYPSVANCFQVNGNARFHQAIKGLPDIFWQTSRSFQKNTFEMLMGDKR